MYFNINFNYNNVITETNIFKVGLPIDVILYNNTTPQNSTFDDSHYLNENIYVNCLGINTGVSWCGTGYTDIILTEDMFKTGNTIYVQNLYLKDSGSTVIDKSSSYKILYKSGTTLTIDLLSSSIQGCILIGQPRASFYRGLEVSILRVSDDNSTTFSQRYNVTYKII